MTPRSRDSMSRAVGGTPNQAYPRNNKHFFETVCHEIAAAYVLRSRAQRTQMQLLILHELLIRINHLPDQAGSADCLLICNSLTIGPVGTAVLSSNGCLDHLLTVALRPPPTLPCIVLSIQRDRVPRHGHDPNLTRSCPSAAPGCFKSRSIDHASTVLSAHQSLASRGA
jgi:hypothetical protein